MNITLSNLKMFLVSSLAFASLSVAAQAINVSLSGSQEVPAVTTSASGSGTITIAPDLSVSGSVTTMGVDGTMAHIHMAATGQNGPVIVPMTKTTDQVWSIPTGAKLTDAQYQSFKAGNLYVNVHSAANKGGEIRGQLKP
ncbi:MAG: CHRD domain-containing protein [Betaproteobacteria bacterium]|nr:CHRD domain-containing protein [Betaproteobacteria bacterium]